VPRNFRLTGITAVPQAIEKSRRVFICIENFECDRCVDLFLRQDGSFGFEEFRRDAEDREVWTRVQYYAGAVYVSQEETLAAAMKSVVWLADAASQSPSAVKLLRRTSN